VANFETVVVYRYKICLLRKYDIGNINILPNMLTNLVNLKKLRKLDSRYLWVQPVCHKCFHNTLCQDGHRKINDF